MNHPARTIILAIIAVSVAVSGLVIFSPKKTEAGISSCIAAAASSLGLSAVSAVINVGTSNIPTETATGAETSKDCILDGIAIAIREALIRKITSATVEWINSGFEGSPAFVTNMEDFLLDTADEAFGQFIYDETNFAFLCSNLQYDIRFAIALSYAGRNSRPACTLSGIVDNVENAVDNLSVEWDWDVYRTVTTDPSSNPFLGLIQVSEDVSNLLNEEQQQQLDDVNRGGGFLSFQHCRPRGSATNTYENNGNAVQVQGSTLTNSTFDDTDRSGQDCEIATPGSIIRQGLSDNLGLDAERIGLADEFDEIIGALMGQLFKQVFSGEGLRGVSQRSGSSRDFLSEYRQDSESQGESGVQELSNSIQAYRDNAETYIGIQEERIDRLADARIQVESAFACYETKYNTWIDQSGNVIAPAQVNSIPESNRTRATFAYLTTDPPAGAIYGGMVFNQTRVLLTPQVSLQKLQEIGGYLDTMDSDIASAEAGIADAEQVIEKADEYLAGFEESGTEESFASFQQFSREIPDINVDSSSAELARQTTIRFIEDVLLGALSYTSAQPERSGGVTEDLAQCQLFSQIYTGD